MEIGAYFDRIGQHPPRAPTLDSLAALMRAHAAAVPFENLDVQLGRPLGIGVEPGFAKLVGARRGGWCFEQNGVFGWVLAQIGFEVRRLCCGVMRERRGDDAIGNHLALKVVIDGAPWLVDVGFGGSLAAPIPLAEGSHRHAPYAVSLARTGDGHWRFAETTGRGDPFSFDFVDGPADEALLAARCAQLQTDAESPFVQNLVVQQRQGETHVSLRGRVLVETHEGGETRALIAGADELVQVLRTRFGLEMPEAAGLWDRICARHAVLFPEG